MAAVQQPEKTEEPIITTTTINTTTEVFISDDDSFSDENEEIGDVVDTDDDGTLDIDIDVGDITNHMTNNLIYASEAKMISEFNKLSITQREQINYDIHGIDLRGGSMGGPVEETLDLLSKSLKDLTKELQILSISEPKLCKAYGLALVIDSKFVKERDFELMFLRADKFDIKLAALRLVKHFDLKLELFGSDKLCQNIIQDDLGLQDESSGMYDGFKQVLPLRDLGGRLVFLDMISKQENEDQRSIETRLKRKFYSGMVAAEEIETQRNGTVVIAYAVDAPYVRYEFTYMDKVIKCLDSLPLRIEAVHFCHNSNWTWTPKIALFRVMSTIINVLKTKVHYGSHQECLFQLSTYGIPVDVFPIDLQTGQVTQYMNDELWKQRRQYERDLIQYNQSLNEMEEEEDDDDDVNNNNNNNMLPPQQQEEKVVKTTADSCNEVAAVVVVNKATIINNKCDGSDGEEEVIIPNNTADDDVINNNNQTSPRLQQQQYSSSTTESNNNTKAKQPSFQSRKMILLPNRTDVLLGRGKKYNCHVGNVRFRHLVLLHKQRYDTNSTRDEKKQMTIDIMDIVKREWNGRFLKQSSTKDSSGGIWYIVDDEEARLKVSHTFRNLNKTINNTNNTEKSKKRKK